MDQQAGLAVQGVAEGPITAEEAILAQDKDTMGVVEVLENTEEAVAVVLAMVETVHTIPQGLQEAAVRVFMEVVEMEGPFLPTTMNRESEQGASVRME